MTDSSLILSAAQAERAAPAFSFFSEEDREASERLAQAGEFTGERLFRDRPGIYSAIVRMAAEGLSISAAARALGVSRNTVVAVREREGISIEQDKKELMKLLGTARRLSVEKVIELIPDLKSAKDAAITAAVMVDKYALLAGEATSRVERVEVRPDQVQAYLDALPVVDAEFEVISMGVPAETPGQRAAGLEGSSDLQSDVSGPANTVQAGEGTTSRTTDGVPSGPPPGAGQGGGGGAGDGDGAPRWIQPGPAPEVPVEELDDDVAIYAIARRHHFNRRLLGCEIEGKAGMINVAVRDSAFYRAGEKFAVQLNDTGSWEAAHHRTVARRP
jgi:transposase-like protein